MFFLVEDTKAGKSLSIKLAKQAKPGALILLDKEEMEASKSMVTIGYMENNNSYAFIPFDPDKKYIAVVDGSINIGHLRLARTGLKLKMAIVRKSSSKESGE